MAGYIDNEPIKIPANLKKQKILDALNIPEFFTMDESKGSLGRKFQILSCPIIQFKMIYERPTETRLITEKDRELFLTKDSEGQDVSWFSTENQKIHIYRFCIKGLTKTLSVIIKNEDMFKKSSQVVVVSQHKDHVNNFKVFIIRRFIKIFEKETEQVPHP
jgi:hypothetical protein